MLNKDRAICLRTVDYSDTSQIVTLFARAAGKIEAMAKGSKRARSSFDGPIELLSCGDIIYSDRHSGELVALTEFEQTPVFRGLRAKYYELNCALFAAELVNRFTEVFDPHPELFDALEGFVGDLVESDSERVSLARLIVFQLNLLGETGSMPLLNKCSNCSKPYTGRGREIYFSSKSNGLLCPGCEQSFIEKTCVSNKCASALADPAGLCERPEAVLKEAEKTLIYHFTNLLHRRPKMAGFFA